MVVLDGLRAALVVMDGRELSVVVTDAAVVTSPVDQRCWTSAHRSSSRSI